MRKWIAEHLVMLADLIDPIPDSDPIPGPVNPRPLLRDVWTFKW